MALFKPTFKALINLIYPLRCQVCKVELDPENERYLCEACLEKIRRNPPPYCEKCGRSLPGGKGNSICGECLKTDYHFNRAGAPCLYEGVIKDCIHLLKYGKKLCLIGPLSQLMVDFVKTYLDPGSIDLVVPIPLHSVKLREREFNQAELLARRIKTSLGIPLISNNLRRVKLRPPQTTLSRKERLANLEGAFKVKKPGQFRGTSILLIDDVFTTGATANESSKVLLEAGAKKVRVLTLARGG